MILWKSTDHSNTISANYFSQLSMNIVSLTNGSKTDFLKNKHAAHLEEYVVYALRHLSIFCFNHTKLFKYRLLRRTRERWSPHAWSPRLLKTWNFCVVQNHLFLQSFENLEYRIVEDCDFTRNTPGIIKRIRQTIRRRLESCISVRDAYFKYRQLQTYYFY